MGQGHKIWAITGGNIPVKSTGTEPENTSRNVLHILNTGHQDANICITIYYAEKPPSGIYKIAVKAQRMRSIRFNDLIDPEAIPLATDFASVIHSDVPIIAGFSKTDTGSGSDISTCMTAYPIN